MREAYRLLYSEISQKPSVNDKIGGGAGGQPGTYVDDKRPHGSRTGKTPKASKNAPSIPPSYAPKDPGRERYTRKTKTDSEWEDTNIKMKGGSSSTDTVWTDDTEAEKHSEEEVCMCGPRKELEAYFAKENLSPVGFKIHISEHAMGELQDFFGEGNIKSIKISESVAKIPYFAKILAAYPTKSLNGRIYSQEVLDDASKRYIGKPFILDHDYEDSYKVHGKIVGAHYGVEESPYLKRKREGLWLDAIGLMPTELVSTIQGEGPVPALLRGVSIGGEGDAEPTSEGMKLKKFFPTELSVTAFPGIEGAHIADFQTISESYKS